ncbi:zinc ribbon domain-containing protein [Salinirubellus salinus]|uniref:Zinc ribbon domain-containing protein n=1 Tax=Salinirubellus salinus TaxID=1364945 RepID=A0A9E7R0X8_9EURY|nr:zinc ribbon domain-containing protein [Salinirubellus salinus]UWM53607.1 zinc ribbon domain-containing protein [Salinirubellus salinus]
MSKITFRADDDLIEQLEEFDASKSEVMREALREYLGEPTAGLGTQSTASDTSSVDPASGSLDEMLVERIDALIEDRLDAYDSRTARKPQDVNVNITLDGDSGSAGVSEGEARKTPVDEGVNEPEPEAKTCKQCGDDLPPSAVYCANCGEKASHRVFCDCGDEIRSDWAFCPSCGRRTPAADVLDKS